MAARSVTPLNDFRACTFELCVPILMACCMLRRSSCQRGDAQTAPNFARHQSGRVQQVLPFRI